jgi:[ribosomal protein S5]-alanine N-acetyltransferase
MLTARIAGRRPAALDEEHYRTLLLQPEISEWLQPAPLPPVDENDPPSLLRRDRLHWAEHGFGPWVLIERRSGEFLGRAGLEWTSLADARVLSVSWAVVPWRWGEGLATEAARAAIATAAELGLAEVVSFTLPENVASRRVMEKIGLRRDGEARHAGLPHVVYRLRLARDRGQAAAG